MEQDKRLNFSEQPVRLPQVVGVPSVGATNERISDVEAAIAGKANSVHTHAQSEVTGLTSDLTAIDGRLDALEAKVPAAHYLWPVASGNYFDQSVGAIAKSTIAAAADRLDMMPFVAGFDAALQSIAIEVTTGVASALCRIGIYADAAGVPGALLDTSADLDCSTTGMKTHTLTRTLSAGTRYWLAVLSNSTQTYRGVPVAAMLPLGVPAAGSTVSYTLRRATQTFASGLPSTGPAGVLVSAIGPAFKMQLA